MCQPPCVLLGLKQGKSSDESPLPVYGPGECRDGDDLELQDNRFCLPPQTGYFLPRMVVIYG